MSASVPQELRPVVSPRGAPPEGEVTLTMTGLPPLQPIRIGFGSFHQNQNFGRAEAGEDGRVTVTVRVPDWAEQDRVHFFYVSQGNRAPRAFSDAFHVTAPDGTVRISGTISTVPAGSCVEMDGPDGTLYALQGDLGLWYPGDRVDVVGTVADGAGCSGRGLPIAVREMRAG